MYPIGVLYGDGPDVVTCSNNVSSTPVLLRYTYDGVISSLRYFPYWSSRANEFDWKHLGDWFCRSLFQTEYVMTMRVKSSKDERLAVEC